MCYGNQASVREALQRGEYVKNAKYRERKPGFRLATFRWISNGGESASSSKESGAPRITVSALSEQGQQRSQFLTTCLESLGDITGSHGLSALFTRPLGPLGEELLRAGDRIALII